MKSIINSDSVFEIYKSLFDYNLDACYALDLEGNFVLFNDASVELTGYSKEEVHKLSYLSFLRDDCIEDALVHFRTVIQKGKRERFLASINDKNGNKKDISIAFSPIYIDKQVRGVVGMAKDITEKNNLETLLNEQNKILEMIAQGSSFTEVLDNIIYLVARLSNNGLCSILLLDEDGTNLIRGSSPNLPLEYNEFINNIPIGPNAGSCGTAAYLKRDIMVIDIATDPLWTEYKDKALKHNLRACWSAPVYDNHQKVLGVFAMYYEEPGIPKESDKKIIKKATYLTSLAIQHYRAEEKINFMAFHDALTGLPNRRLFGDRINNAIMSFHPDQEQQLGLLYLDLDRFKLINDSLGHNIGDLLLREVGHRLQSCIRNNDTASRQGGDEFTILLDGVTGKETSIIAQRILDVLVKPFIIGGNEIFVSPSIGISLYPIDGVSSEELLRKADIAMYHAKKEGRNNYQFYDVMLDKRTYERLEMENELRKAIARNELTLLYQPIIDLSTNEVNGVEALLRWVHPRLGIVSPKQFIPIAEETGMIVSIGEWVIRTACQQIKLWQSGGLFLQTVSVNISMRQFYQQNLIPLIQNILIETGINPNKLTIEITESMTMEVKTATTILYDLKGLGVNISIDDFGTGYSSLSYLQTFPIDYLKIDRSFIRNIASNKDDENIATTILLMAHNLGLKVIAEGVETSAQLEVLKQHKCREAQGYLFSKPLSAVELKRFVNNVEKSNLV